jgi:hypothetical protein
LPPARPDSSIPPEGSTIIVRKLLACLTLSLALTAVSVAPALAGSPHFVGAPTLTRSGDALTVAGKVAGLGDETQITVTVTADVQCVNPGNNEPQAENKGAVVASATVPVQNGKANFSVTGTGTTDPACSPPMVLRYDNVVVTVSDTSFEPFSYTFTGSF